MANLRVEINTNGITQGVRNKWSAGLYKLVAVMRDDCNKYCKMTALATTRKSSYTASLPDKGLIIWNTPYAKYAYLTGRPRKTYNPNASLQWCEKAKAEYLDKWRRMAAAMTGGK